MAEKLREKNKQDKSRAEIIIDELESGGFSEDELNEIIDVCGEQIALQE